MWRSKPRVELCRVWIARLRAAWSVAVRGARLAVGVPDYDAYVRHCLRRHPDRAPMSREAFFRERMAARYDRGRSRCC